MSQTRQSVTSAGGRGSKGRHLRSKSAAHTQRPTKPAQRRPRGAHRRMRAYTPPDWVMLVVVLAGLLFVIAALGVAFSDVSQSCFEVGARYLSVFDVLNVAVTLLLTPLNYFVMKLSRRGAFLAFLCLTFLGVAGLFAFNLSTYADTASYFLGVRVSLLSSVLAVASSR